MQDMLFAEIGVPLVSKKEELVDNIENEKEQLRLLFFDCCFMSQENADTLPFLICRDSRFGLTGATCCERKGPTAYSISFLVGFIRDLGFRRIIF